MTRDGLSGSVASSLLATSAPTGDGLLGVFRILAGGEELEDVGATLLERTCHAFRAEEGALLLAGPGPDEHAVAGGFVPGPCWGGPGPRGWLGARAGDRELVEAAAAVGRPLQAGPHGDEAWCALMVEGRAVGVLALRRDPAEVAGFGDAELAAVELVATAAAVAVDRLRFLHLWSRKLAQADAAHSQLLRYADDLRTTFAAERHRAEELRAALGAVEEAYAATVRALATAVEAKDAYTGGHLARVTAYGVEACRALGGDLADTAGLECAFLLHDLGKIGVPDAVLNKAGPLTDEEWALMREHPAIGLRILDGVPHMEVVRAVVYCHHERWDGAGYPEGLKGEDIPLAARVFAAVDAFDAITTDRPYRAAVGLDEALARLRGASGRQFAPDAVDAIHLVDRERLAAIQATATRGR
ncbi:MAG TPA: HD-GYP domain-containing protein [Actinomycetes bacterium]|nr:HD-GYP domain-containing protein [Actinomycetes bacterium]